MTIRRFSKSPFKSFSRKERPKTLRELAQRGLQVEPLEERQLLAVNPIVTAIQTNSGVNLLDSGLEVFDVAPGEVTFRFNSGQVIDVDTLSRGIVVTRAGGDGLFADEGNNQGTANDVRIDFSRGYLGPGEFPNEIVARFPETLPDDLYRIQIFGLGNTPLRNSLGDVFDGDREAFGIQNTVVKFDLNLGAQIVSVVPQPIERKADGTLSQVLNQIVVFFNNDKLASGPVTTTGAASDPTVVQPDFYQLIRTGNTATNTDDTVINPTSVTYEPAANRAVLTFANDLIDPETYRLRIGTDEAAPGAPVDFDLGLAADPPLVGEVNRGTLIDNDFATLSPGFFSFDVLEGGASGSNLGGGRGGITERGVASFLTNENVIFDYLHYVDVGLPGGAISLGATNVTQQAQLIGDDLVASEGFFTGDNGQRINWRVETSMEDGGNRVTNRIMFSSTMALGRLRVINYLDEDIASTADDLLRVEGTPGQADFRLFTLDGPERVGFSQGGVYSAGPDLTNAVYDGWAADSYADLQIAIEGSGTTYSVAGNIDLTDLPPIVDPSGSPAFGLADVTTAMAWTVNQASTSATVTTFIELVSDTPIPNDAGSSFTDASPLGTLGVESLVINSRIENITSTDPLYALQYPGSSEEPGHRNIEFIEDHLNAGPDETPGITTQFYNFRSDYGFDPDGNPLENVITTEQKQRAREVFELYGQYLGIDFIETDFAGMTIATGDLRALDPTIATGPGGIIGLAGLEPTRLFPLAIMDKGEDLDAGTAWQNRYGESWFQTAMHEIGHLLGLGHTYDLPELTIQGADGALTSLGNNPEGVFPGDHDNVHGQHLYRPESKDIDLFRFEVAAGQEGLFAAETFAERFADSSTLNTVLNLYAEVEEEQPDGSMKTVRHLLSRNDDYFSQDSFLELELEAGIYYIGVTSTGNSIYDPTIADSGIGGTSEGPYELRLTFRPNADRSITDVDGTRFDGDADGVPGGVHDFWFQTATPTGHPISPPAATDIRAVYVDKLAPTLLIQASGAQIVDGTSFSIRNSLDTGAGFGQLRTFEFDSNDRLANINNERIVYDASMTRQQLAVQIASAINAAENFSVYAAAAAQPTMTGEVRLAITGEQSFTLPGTLAGLIVAAPAATGSLLAPFDSIEDGLFAARPPAGERGNIVRLVGNGGIDGLVSTRGDNFAYEVGKLPTAFNSAPLSDGTTLKVPRGVNLMIDAGANLKFKQAAIEVGSTAPGINRAGGVLQVLGTPVQNVLFTSYDDQSVGVDTNPLAQTPVGSNWGGLFFKNDLDRAGGRFDYEDEAIFLNYVNHADLRYGGSTLNIDSVPTKLSPIEMIDSRPTITFNTITNSSEAAMSANPDSFEETNFHSPRFQTVPYTSDYDRIGPEIHGNRFIDPTRRNVQGELVVTKNSINGLLVRIPTVAGRPLDVLSVAGRFDDADIVHILSENLVIQGTPGGQYVEVLVPPQIPAVTVADAGAGSLPAGSYSYIFTHIDRSGFEGPPSAATAAVAVGADGALRIDPLPPLRNVPEVKTQFTGRRVYRSEAGGAGPYTLVAQLLATDTFFVDDGTSMAEGTLITQPSNKFHSRLDASLVVDPNIVIKADGARIETNFGGQLIAEGLDGLPVVITSTLDDRFGRGGTYDTNNDDANEAQPSPGNWGGIFAGPTGALSIDQAILAYGGGRTRVPGNFASFNVVEVHQAAARITNSVFEFNDDGVVGSGSREGRGTNAPGTIFVLGAQPIIVANQIRQNEGPAINANVNALNHFRVVDSGRWTGNVDLFLDFNDNQGPLIRNNVLTDNAINGMVVRPGTLTTEGVWDDTDIVHVVFGEIAIPDFHTYGGLRLESGISESLVVKLAGADAGFTAEGRQLDISDRIGGILHVLGQPGQPVVLTSLADDTTGAGFDSTNRPQNDTNNDGAASVPAPGDWRSVKIDQFAHDRNIGVVVEREASAVAAADVNAAPGVAQFLGNLAPNEKGGDENLRLGFDVQGYLNSPDDVDVFSFRAEAGTEVYFDIDSTTHALDIVLELVNADGTTLARSNNSTAEELEIESLFSSTDVTGRTLPREAPFFALDRWTTNPRDAAMRLTLPEPPGEILTYHVRVRSNHPDLGQFSDDPNAHPDDVATDLFGGLTSGGYQLQIRMREIDEFAGSTIQYSDIRFAENGIEVIGQPTHSPILVEAREGDGGTSNIPGAQPVGNLLATERAALAIAGQLDDANDVDLYEFEINVQAIQNAPGSNSTTVPFGTVIDLDYADGFARANTILSLFNANGNLIYTSRDSNISDDRPKPLNGDDLDDTSRGSIGPLDPYLGNLQLPQGTYYLAVSANQLIPQEIDQFSLQNPTNPLVRLAPIGGITRIAQDNVTVAQPGLQVPVLFSEDWSLVARSAAELVEGETFAIRVGNVSTTFELDTDGTFDPANIQVAYLPTDPQIEVERKMAAAINGAGIAATITLPRDMKIHLPTANLVTQVHGPGERDTTLHVSRPSEVEYTLSDVVFFVNQEKNVPPTRANLLDESLLHTVDPFTGVTETTFPFYDAHVGDIAMRPDGTLVSLTRGDEMVPFGATDANSGHFLTFDTGTGVPTDRGDDGILTYEIDANGAIVISHPTPARVGDGIQNNALTVGFVSGNVNSGVWMLGVGDRGPAGQGVTGPDYFTNILYLYEPDTGLATSTPQPDRTGNQLATGAGTNIYERGELLTSARITAVDATDVVVQAQQEDDITRFNINDGNSVTVVNGASVTTFEFDTGPEIRQNYSVLTGQTIQDGNFFILDPDAQADNDERLYQLDTGPVIEFYGNVPDGLIITIRDEFNQVAVFEVERDTGMNIPPQTDPNAVPLLAPSGQPTLIAGLLTQEINNQAFDVVAVGSGSRVTITVDAGVEIGPPSFNGGARVIGGSGIAPIVRLVDGSQLIDGQTFQVDTFGTGGIPVTFEFDSGIVLDVPAAAAGPGGIADGETFTVDDGTNFVVFEFDNNNDLEDRIITTSGALIPDGTTFTIDDLTNLVSFEYDRGYRLQVPAVGADRASGIVDGNSFTLTNGGPVLNFEFDTGYILRIPNQGGSPGGIVDGEKFTITGPGFGSATFEFDINGSVEDVDMNGQPDNIVIPYAITDSPNRISQLIGQAVAAAGVGMTPAQLANGELHLGGTPNHTVNLDPASAIQIVTSAGIAGDIAISVDPFASQNVVSNAIITAIQNAGLGLTPLYLGAGEIHVGGDINHVLNAAGTPTLQVLDTPGTIDPNAIEIDINPTAAMTPSRVAFLTAEAINQAVANGDLDPSISATSDGGSVVVSGRAIVDLTGTPFTTTSNTAIPIDPAQTEDQIAQTIANVVGGAFPGVLTPAVLANGRVQFHNPLFGVLPDIDIDVSMTSVVLAGSSGVTFPNIAVPFLASDAFTVTDVANSMTQALVNVASAPPALLQVFPAADAIFEGQLLAVPDPDTNNLVFFVFDDIRTPFIPGGGIIIPIDKGAAANPNTVPPTAAVPAQSAIQVARIVANEINRAFANGALQYVRAIEGGNGSVYLVQYGLSVTTQIVDDLMVINGQQITYIQDTSPIAPVPIFNSIETEEAYDMQLPPSILPPFPPNFANNIDITDDNIGFLVAMTINADLPPALNPIANTAPNLDPEVGADGERINFFGYASGDFRGVPSWVVQRNVSEVFPGSVRVKLLADDTADEVAIRLANAIDNALNPEIDALATNEFVRLNKGEVFATNPFTTKGAGPGGKITGIATIAGVPWVVSDHGGLYRVDNALSDRPPLFPPLLAETDYIESSANDLLGISFAGLTAGPPSVEGGRYANLLFGITDTGMLYAFDRSGVLQPVFVDGQSSIQTAVDPTVGPINGIAFSTLDSNLWRFNYPPEPTPICDNLPEREYDAGHSGPIPGACLPVSIQFGRGEPGNYDFPGGAHGSIVSNPFSLEGYSANDLPVLYFTYFSDTEDDPLYDSLRVFIAGDDGDWQAVATNNQGGGQPVFDNSNAWRQARIDLGAFAGRENLRLRFDFSTAGDMDVGVIGTTGDELRAIHGSDIRDEDSFEVGIAGQRAIFEFDMGVTATTQTGGLTVAGETLTITDGGGQTVTFTFNKGAGAPTANDVDITAASTAEEVALALAAAIRLSGLAVVPRVQDGNRINLDGATTVVRSAGASTQLEGAIGVDPGLPGVEPAHIPIVIHADMTREEVAEAMQQVMERIFTNPALILGDGADFADGDNFTLTEQPFPTGTPIDATFEFDSGFILSIPQIGTFPNGIGDGETVEITNATAPGSPSVIFEFDVAGDGVAMGNRNVRVGPNTSAAVIANVFTAELIQAIIDGEYDSGVFAVGSPLEPRTVGGNSVHIGGVPGQQMIINGVAPTIGPVGAGEQDSSIGQANETGLVPRNRVTATGRIGDGAFGADPLRGDYDFYAVRNVNLDEPISVDVDAFIMGSALDATVGVYNSSGELLDIALGDGVSVDPFFVFDPSNPRFVPMNPAVDGDDYFIVVHGSGSSTMSFQANPFNAASGQGIGTIGDYTITIGLDSTLALRIANNGLTAAPGVQAGNVPLYYRPADDFTSADMGVLLANRINAAGGYSVLTATAVGNRVVLDSYNEGTQTRTIPSITNIDMFSGNPLGLLRFEPVGETAVKLVNNDLVRVIGRPVIDPGPLGFDAPIPGQGINLPGDVTPIQGGFNSIRRGQNNANEGVYIDDIVIGFAEHGEAVSAAGSNTNFATNPLATAVDIDDGAYQVEIRRTSDPELALDSTDAIPTVPADTNDRNVAGFTIEVRSGAKLIDGESFAIGDGINSVTFTYRDNSLGTVLDTPFTIPFLSTEEDYQIALRLVNKINGPVIQQLFKVYADFSDRTFRDGAASTSNRVNLAGDRVTIDAVNGVPTRIGGFFTLPDGFTMWAQLGDENRFRDQGQIFISNNVISNSNSFGIVSDAGQRDAYGNSPHQGPAGNLVTPNRDSLAIGVTITNNVIYGGGLGGIHFSGDPSLNGIPMASVPYGRVLNNTIFGLGGDYFGTVTGFGDTGILVDENAGPTLLNNIIANFANGLVIDASSRPTTVLGAMLFSSNLDDPFAVNAALGDDAILLEPGDPLFVGAENGNFYLAFGAKAIDSATDSIEDRVSYTDVIDELGISRTPILAPEEDITGQRRGDDPSVDSESGVGGDVFKDRGAIDRIDFIGPTVRLQHPIDNGTKDDGFGGVLIDRNSTVTAVLLNRGTVDRFDVQLLDETDQNTGVKGIGIDDTTVAGTRIDLGDVTALIDKYVLARLEGDDDFRVLAPGIDFEFSYDATNNVLRFVPTGGIWERGRRYEITVVNDDRFVIPGTLIFEDNLTTEITVQEVFHGGTVADGASFFITDTRGNTEIFEYDSGYTLEIPETVKLQLPEAGGQAISDGETFVVTNGANPPVTFEFDSGYTLQLVLDLNGDIQISDGETFRLNSGVPGAADLVFEFHDTDDILNDFVDANNDGLPDNTLIEFDATTSAVLLGDRIALAIEGENLGITPSNLRNGSIHLGGYVGLQVDTSTSAGLTDIGSPGVSDPTFIPVDILPLTTFTVDDLADAIAASIATQNSVLGLNPRNLNDGRVHIDGPSGQTTVDVTGTPSLLAFGAPQIVLDTQTLVISDLSRQVIFEFDNNGDATNRPILIDNTMTEADLADAIVAAIIAENLNFSLTPTTTGPGIPARDSLPHHFGDGVIQLGGVAGRHVVNAAGSPNLILTGTPGVLANSNPIYYASHESFDSVDVAKVTQRVVNNRIADNRLLDITTRIERDWFVVVGAEDMGSSRFPANAPILFQEAISDLAGLPLTANQADASTSFEITIDAGVDFGDAPSPYPTLRAQGGAIHSIAGSLGLGLIVDNEEDGQPTDDVRYPDGDGIDEDGIFVRRRGEEDVLISDIDLQLNHTETIVVLSTGDAFVNAWIDFNGNGDWGDDGDQIFTNQPVVAGENMFEVTIPATIAPGTVTQARFRLNSAGDLSFTGTAADGEVEDYAVTFNGNPWSNFSNPLDVNGSGTITSLDTAIIVTELIERKFSAAGVPLPVPPVDPYIPAAGSPFAQFVDTNNDGFLSVLDVLAINEYFFEQFLQRQNTSPPPVEAPSEVASSSPSGLAPPLSAAFAVQDPLELPLSAVEIAPSDSAETLPLAAGQESVLFGIDFGLSAGRTAASAPQREAASTNTEDDSPVQSRNLDESLTGQLVLEGVAHDAIHADDKSSGLDLEELLEEISADGIDDASSLDELFTRLGR